MSKRNVLTIESLRYYVPIYQKASEASEILNRECVSVINHESGSVTFKSDSLKEDEISELVSLSNRRNIALNNIIELCLPLMYSEINKLLSSSHLKNQGEKIIEILLYNGMEGVKKGLMKFNVDKLKKSSTNYLFQWFNVYAKQELLKIESPYGIPPTRFSKYKKISAVRKRMTAELMREPSNIEVYEYFQSGRADLNTLNGPLDKKEGKYSSNQAITIELIEEQDHYERILSQTVVVDFRETMDGLEGVFLDTSITGGMDVFEKFVEENDFREEAKKVLYAIIDSTGSNSALIHGMTEKKVKKIENQWIRLLTDRNGIFKDFLVRCDFQEEDFPVSEFMSKMKDQKPQYYQSLFEKRRRKNV